MKENITNTIPRISIQHTSLGCPIHRPSWPYNSNNKTNFVHVFPSDIKPRFLKNLPHSRVRFLAMSSSGKWLQKQNKTTNQHIRNAGEIHSTNIVKENITNTIPRISIQHTSLGCPIHRPSWPYNSNNKTNFVHVFPSDIKPRFLKNLPHSRVRFLAMSSSGKWLQKQNKTTNQHIRNAGEIHSTNIVKEITMNNRITSNNNKNVRVQLVACICTALLVLPGHNSRMLILPGSNAMKSLCTHSAASKTLGNKKNSDTEPFSQLHRVSAMDMLCEPRATYIAILTAVRSRPNSLHEMARRL